MSVPSDPKQLITLLKEPAAVCRVNNDKWELVQANRYLAELLGCKRNELLRPGGVRDFQLDDLLGDPRETMERLKAKEPVVVETAFPVGAGGTLQLEIHLSLLEEPESRVLLLASDASHAKWLQTELLRGCEQVLASGTFLPSLTVETLDIHTEEAPSPLRKKARLSVLDFLPVADQSLLQETLEALKKRGRSGEPKEVVLHTRKLRARAQKVRCCIAPFLNGSGKLVRYAFVVNRLDFLEQPEDPSVRLKMLMMEKGISATEMSRLTGLSMTTISKLRNGKIQTPRRLTSELVAAELGVRTTEIWTD